MSEDSKIIVTEWFKSSAHTEKYVIKISRFNNQQYIDARLHFTDDEGKNWKFTRKGINVSKYHLDKLIEGLQKAKAMLEGSTQNTEREPGLDDDQPPA